MASDSNGGSEQLVAIIGGMGPMAGVKLQELIVNRTKATRDCDHVSVLAYTNPKVPPRIGDFGLQCVPEIIRSVQAMERAGATQFAIACNTAHMFQEEILAEVKIPIISLLEETAKHLAANFGSSPTIGILGTLSLLKSGLYQSTILAECPQATILLPVSDDQASLDELIQGPNGIKAGHLGSETQEPVRGIAQGLITRGATVIVTACTELPLVFNASLCADFPARILDPMIVVADHIIRISGAEVA
ncbi:aspartate racemase-like [Sycon ciliatum]|uniref:aspartate racemase-like n=1 Tax=Sycon ciliatum TaxID=27933 RepID=UPI0020A901F4|eukprot:scpid73684/ scgid26767/ Aspartate racemase